MSAGARHTGQAGQRLVEFHLLARGWNVGPTLVDIGDDVLAIRDSDCNLSRIQVKTGHVDETTEYGYTAQFRVGRDQLERDLDPPLIYAFVLLDDLDPGPIVIISQPELLDRVQDDDLGSQTDYSYHFYLRYHRGDDGDIETILCSDADFTPYMNDFSRWPPIDHQATSDEDASTTPTNLGHSFTGQSGHHYVISEFLDRGWNVTPPAVDTGDDLLVLRHSDHETTRLQVKTARAKSRRYGFSTKLFVGHDHLHDLRDPPLVYAFAPRLPSNYWGPMLLIPQADLLDLVTDEDMGTDMASGYQFYIRFHGDPLAIDQVLSSDSDLTPYLDDFSRWPRIVH